MSGSARGTMSEHVRERTGAARAGDELEYEQAKVRLVTVTIAELYFVFAFLWDRSLDDGELLILAIIGGVFLLGVAHFCWILWRPGVNHLRRRAAVLLDMSAITAGMVLAEEPGAMLYGLYLWVVIGNGF